VRADTPGTECPAAVVAWAGFQPRTAVLATELGGRAWFVTSGSAPLPLRYLACAVRTWRLLGERRPGRVLVITPPVVAPLVVWLWCRRHGRPFVADCHTETFHGARWAWARPLHRWLLRRAEVALVHTEEAQELLERWGTPALLLPDDLPDPADAEPRAPAARPVVLVAGSLDENEPVADVVAMAALLPDVEVRLTGDPHRLPAELVRGAPGNAVFTGFLPYRRFLGEMLTAGVVAVFSTDPHIMNRAAFEAAGLGRPLVLSDLEGLRRRFGAGARFAENRPEAMAAAVRRALDDRAELAGRSARLAGELRAQRQRAMARLRRVLAGDSPTRVLRVTQHPFPDDSIVRRDVLELLRQGHHVDVVCAAGPPGTATEDLGRPPGLRVRRVPVRHRRRPLVRYPLEYAAFFLSALAVVSWLGLRRRYAVVQVDNLPDALVFAAAVPRWRGARLVLTMYELMPEMAAARFRGRAGAALGWACRAVERAATRWADRVIVVSRPCFDVLRSRGVPAARMSIVLNTISPHPDDGAGRGARGPEPPVLITHTTLAARYGVDVLIRAVAVLAPDWPDLTLRVVGAGEEMGALVRLSESLGLAGRVDFTGNLPWTRTLEEVRRASVGVVAVVADGYGQLLLPTKLLEYAALGVPAVCSRLPAVQAYFAPDALAYFRPGDARDLASQVARLLADPALAACQARCAAETARRLAWDRVRLDYLAALGLPDRCPAD
jgi:glycosyltransferase involved in cell wall biosynthesis